LIFFGIDDDDTGGFFGVVEGTGLVFVLW
jgi:hypothetical protein